MNIDTFKYLVGGYYGVRDMDEYDLKVYVLKDIENYIKEYLKNNPIPNYDYEYEARKLEDELSLEDKLNDSLLVFTKIEVPMELRLLVKRRIKKIKLEELRSNKIS